MFIWEKKGRVFDPTKIEGKPWLKEFAQAPETLIFKNFIRIFFACRPNRNKDTGQYISYTGFVDVNKNNLFDIIKFSKGPVLPLGGKGAFDEFGTYPTSVQRDGERLVCYYGGWTRCFSVPFNVGIGKAYSYDQGETFIKVGNGGPILPYTPSEPFILSGPKIRRFNNKWFLFYIAGEKWILDSNKPEPVYKIRLAISNDGKDWRKINRNLISSVLEEDEAQASPDVIYWKNRYHMFFCYRFSKNYRNNDRGYRIGYAYSNDLINWKRDDKKVGIEISSKESFDDQSIAYPHLFRLDNEMHMLYLGNHVGRRGFGWAKLVDYKV